MSVKRSISASSSQLSSYHCHCPCHKHRQQSALSAFDAPFSNIIPTHFKLGHHGTTRISWSRYNTPKSKEVARIVKSPRDAGVAVTNVDHWPHIIGGKDSSKSAHTRPSGSRRTTGSRSVSGARSGGKSLPSGYGRTTGSRSVSGARLGGKSLTSGYGRMGKTVTETATRVYSKDGKRFQEIVETVTKEDEAGNTTKTTKTTTKELDPYDTKEMSAAIDKPSTTSKSRTSKGASRKSSTSSSDSSPDRKGTKPKSKTGEKSAKGGLLNKLKSKPSGKSSDNEEDDEEDFIEDVYKGVNECRKKHGVKTLKLSKEMNKYAKEWARKLAADEKMAHRPDNKYGENVYCVSSNSKTFTIKGNEVVDKWYSEMKDHVFGQEPKGSLLKSGHFSQMVWKDAKQMGVGRARSAAGTKIFVVANFDPQGNWMGQFATQVPPVGGFTKSASQGKSTPSVTSKSRKSSSSSDSDSDGENFAEDCLKSHNNYRKKHGVPPLKLSKDLSKFALDWAKTIAKKNVLQHRDNNNYGENLYCAWSSNPKHQIKGEEAVDSWYSEIKDYSFGREPADLRAGHFTQVVWADSKELGLGVARSSSGKIFVVANYSPAGNYVGSFATKVPKTK